LVLLCLGLALGTFLGYSKAVENADIAQKATADQKQAQTLADAYQIEAQILRALVGEHGESINEISNMDDSLNHLKDTAGELTRVELAEIEKQVQAIIEQHTNAKALFLATSGNAQGEDTTYMNLIRDIAATMGKLVNNNVVISNELDRLKIETQSAIDAKQKEVEQIQAALTTAQQDLEAKTQEYNTLKTTMDTTLNEIQLTVKAVEDDRNTIRETLTQQVNTARVAMEAAEKKYDDAKQRLDRMETENWNLPDGEIVRVARTENIVFLNIGMLDGLKTTRTFSVFDAETSDFEKAKTKGSIEVTRVWEKQAEARITSEDPLKPILPNDIVINPVWDPGYSVPIALAGEFDLDHDGFDDRERLIRMIQQNGGNVVAYHDDEGNVIGEIDASTRWFVMGDPPKADINPRPEVNRAIRQLKDAATDFEIHQIDTRKLLNWMGQHSQPKVERLDRRAGLAPRTPTGTGSGSSN
jgi:hypothetical protein